MTNRRPRVQQLADRFTAINMRSRSVRLNRMTKSGAFDLSRLLRTQRRPVWNDLVELLGHADEGHVDLVRAKPRDKDGRKMATELGTLASAARSDWFETGLRTGSHPHRTHPHRSARSYIRVFERTDSRDASVAEAKPWPDVVFSVTAHRLSTLTAERAQLR